MIEENPRRRVIGRILLTAVLGFFAIAILGIGPIGWTYFYCSDGRAQSLGHS
jgi:hypothetical protein